MFFFCMRTNSKVFLPEIDTNSKVFLPEIDTNSKVNGMFSRPFGGLLFLFFFVFGPKSGKATC